MITCSAPAIFQLRTSTGPKYTVAAAVAGMVVQSCEAGQVFELFKPRAIGTVEIAGAFAVQRDR